MEKQNIILRDRLLDKNTSAQRSSKVTSKIHVIMPPFYNLIRGISCQINFPGSTS